MTTRPEGPKKYDGPVILPGGVPVDPLDPTKGYVTPVATAVEMTAGITELFQAVNILDQHLSMLGRAMQDGFADIGTLIESLIGDITYAMLNDDDTAWLSPAVQEFLDARVKARAEADAAAAEEAEALMLEVEREQEEDRRNEEALARPDDFPDGGMRGED